MASPSEGQSLTLLQQQKFIFPFIFFFLVLPAGMSSGFVCIALPFILTQVGLPVATAGYIVAIGVSANLFRFVWGPVADFTLTPRSWYCIGLVTSASTLVMLGLVPLRTIATGLFETIVFMSQVAATLIILPLGRLMALAVVNGQKGRASGWYQAGNLSGNAIGGSIAIMVTAHYSRAVAACGVSAVMLACALAVIFVPFVRPQVEDTLGRRTRFLADDIRAIFCSAIPLLIVLLVCSPIGAGALTHLWSGLGPYWHSTPSIIFVVTILGGLIGAIGCLVGGWIADRLGVWWAYFGSAIGIAFVAGSMAVTPRLPEVFAAGVLAYVFMQGIAYAAFSTLVLIAIGRGAASTKYALFSSLGNLPVAYMTALDGWMHDRHGTPAMLYFDGLSNIAFVIIAIFFLQRISATRMPGPSLSLT